MHGYHPYADPELIEAKLTELMDSPQFDSMLDAKLESLGSTPMGMMLSMMSLSAAKIKPFIKVNPLSGKIRCNIEKNAR